MLFDPGRVGRQSVTKTHTMTDAGIYTTPSLDLSFPTVSGGLDSRITFTRASTATYFDATGVMQTAVTNAPRFDYDPVTHALRGLLIEEARTNLALFSDQINNGAVWVITAATTVTNATTAPDGTVAAEKIVESATTALHFLTQSHTGTSETATASAYFKAAERTAAFLSLSNQVTASIEAYFDLSAGTVLSVGAPNADYTAPSASIQAVGSGWYRCALTATKGTVNTNNFIALGPSIVSNRNYAGDGSSGIYVWGAQLELGAFPTSYVPTTAAAVTRQPEQCYIPVGSWYNPIALTMSIDYFLPVIAGTYIGISDGSFGNSVYMGASGMFGGGSAGAGVQNPGAVNKQAGSWTPTLLRNCVNGSAIASGAVTGLSLAGAIRMSIGMSPWGLDSQLNGNVRRIRYWPRVLSDVELQQVTT